jgi:hypothetical protein
MRSSERTSTTTVRRVGLEGRLEEVRMSSLRSDHESLGDSAGADAEPVEAA